MAYRLIQRYRQDQEVPALFEDEQGFRLLILEDVTVTPHVWLEAHSAGVMLLALPVGDGWGHVTAQDFMDQREEVAGQFRLPLGKWARADRLLTYMEFYRGDVLEVERPEPEPDCHTQVSVEGFAHLHAHSEMSALDGLSTVKEMVERAVADDQPAVALTDHGVCAGHPELQKQCREFGIKPIFGMEAYFVEDRHWRTPSKPKGKHVTDRQKEEHEVLVKKGRGAYHHLILWAANQEGLKNLWAMSTESHRDGFYYQPRLDWETLEKFNEGVMCSTACLRGPVSVPILAGDETLARIRLARLQSIFDDRLYVELHTTTIEDQRTVNKGLVSLASDLSLPVIAVSDSHYPDRDDRGLHRIWIASQTNKDLTDDTTLFQDDGSDYHLMTTQEVADSLSYLGESIATEAISNTLEVAERCDVTIPSVPERPVFSGGGVQKDVERLVDLCLSNWSLTEGPNLKPQEVYRARFEREMSLLIERRYCGYFLMKADEVSYAKSNGVLVGPGRGSGGGCLVAYLARITTIDPVDHNLLFERFMTEGRDSPPDFDIDYPASKRQFMQDYIRSRWGEEYVIRVGTTSRLRNKGTFRALSKVLRSTHDIAYTDIDAICGIIDQAEADSAGLGYSWEKVFNTYEDAFAPYVEKYPELFEIASRLSGRVKTYGRHAAGWIISTDGVLTESLPMRRSDDDDSMIAQFDGDALEALGYLKHDLLTLRNLDTLQETMDLIKQRRGVTVDVYGWRKEDEYSDPQVWGELGEGNTLGVFQIETHAGTRLTERMKPQSVKELADVITLVRPGPTRSGLTESYLRRREGGEEITYQDPRLERVYEETWDTYGVPIYQEQVMKFCEVLAGYSLSEADAVRRILGKKKVEEIKAVGEEFVPRAVEHGMERGVADTLWGQLEEFSRYCLPGDTVIDLAGSNRLDPLTLAQMYQRLHGELLPPVRGRPKRGEEYRGPCVLCGATESMVWIRGACNSCYQWRSKFLAPNRGLYGLSVIADRVRPCRVLDIIHQGRGEVWRITLSDGKVIEATDNHRHLTDQGLVRVDELRVGDLLVTDAGYEKLSPAEVNARNRVTEGEPQRVGAVSGAFREMNYAYRNGGFADLMAWTATAPEQCGECGHDGSEHRLERAHLDGDRRNNNPDNLAMLCVSCHKRHDYRHNGRTRRWGKGHPVTHVAIESIEYVGEREVYSVVMDDPHILFVGGVATSNSFNCSHALGYAVVAHWTAWFKTHYPMEYLTSILSTVDKQRLGEFIVEARKLGYRILPPDVNESGRGFTATNMAVRYGFDNVMGIGDAATEAIIEGQPYHSFDDFMERKGSAANRKVVKELAAVGAFDCFEPHRRALEERLAWEDSDEAKRCVWKNESVQADHGLPCTFDWDSEPRSFSEKTGRPLKPKRPPKLCTRGCRNYTAPPSPDFHSLSRLTPVEIREREQTLLGEWVTSTPFDDIPESVKADAVTGEEIDGQPNGGYYVFGIVQRIKPITTRTGKPMGFVDLQTERGDLSLTVFTEPWRKFKPIFGVGVLVACQVRKDHRGCKLIEAIAC